MKMIDSSPSSAESSFRELDEVFLQTQTRIWLGEVINSRLDEDLNLSDLLQDGEILFEVSKVVWNLLLTKCMELRHLKHKYGPFGSRKSSGRYRPYSNVDSFIKICKILGLSGIDLFSPSDVVEKRDIRKVCICIRALSKKARSKQLSVPDFDMVVYSVAMPKNMVGVIRKSLESSQCTLSSSSSYSSPKVSQMKLKQKNLHTPCNGGDDYSSSDESDEAESRYMGDNAFSGKFNYAGGVNSDLENSPGCIDEINRDHCKSASLSEMASCGIVSQKQVYNNGITHVNNDVRLENDYSVVGDSSCIDVGDSNYISDYLAFSDLMVHRTDGSNSVIRDGENNMFDFFLNVDNSQGLASNRRSFRNGSQRKFSDDEDTEVSSTTSMSSVLGRLLNLEFDEHFNEDDSLSADDRSSVLKELREAEKHCKDSFVVSEPLKLDTYETDYQTVLFETREAQSDTEDECEFLSGMEPLEGELCGVKTGKPENHVFGSENKDMVAVDDNMPPMVSDDTTVYISVQANLCETIFDNHPCLPVKDMNGAKDDTPVAYNIQDNISYSAAENELSSSQGNNKDASLGLPPGKHGRRPLMRTFVKGTAIAGVLFLLLHISGKGKGNGAQESKQVLKYRDSKSSSTKRQKKIVGKGLYPSEKIKL
ncbi:hypothetical protein PHJA_001426300 [Phtheirospermum japonicum]|uniref:Calponin-homology (CH) domain-containing protein n=1 Tax=Phtheirospermum japonicum TaxID=374723 RepID=A0A830BZC8_9LAMI|nr:hypothetical protein PHJA_001426300 [Phtheirospermum japonicum]